MSLDFRGKEDIELDNEFCLIKYIRPSAFEFICLCFHEL